MNRDMDKLIKVSEKVYLTKSQLLEIAADTISIAHYGKPFNQLPDDGVEQDWIMTAAEEKIGEVK